ncbi:MAG TPA: hypothetical protein PLV45_15515, partial [bacterium]|nr:hypothetical protein [bacterium]
LDHLIERGGFDAALFLSPDGIPVSKIARTGSSDEALLQLMIGYAPSLVQLLNHAVNQDTIDEISVLSTQRTRITLRPVKVADESMVLLVISDKTLSYRYLTNQALQSFSMLFEKNLSMVLETGDTHDG